MAGVLKQLGDGCLAGAKAVWQAGVEFVYPPACPLCGEEVDAHRGPLPALCGACRLLIHEPITNRCERCGAPVGPHLNTEVGCIHCRGERFTFETVYCLGTYHDALRRAVIRGKNPGGEPLIAALGGLLGERWHAEFESLGAVWVVPIPHHWRGRISRKHNAAETLARVLARCLRLKCAPSILTKVRHTPAQTSLTRSERRTNLRRVFRARSAKALTGATILLADDVLTTGTTAHEASKALRDAGAKRVVVAVLARGVGQTA